MPKHLVEINEEELSAARAELGTSTIRETVSQALRLVSADRKAKVTVSLDTLAKISSDDREDAWR